MRNSLVFHTAATAILMLALSHAVLAQSDSQQPAPPAEQKPAAKSHKVWTSDDLGTLRSPADVYLEKEQQKADADAAAAAAAQQAANMKKAGVTKPPRSVAPPRLSNPKTAESADEMIAWEERDIQGQVESIAKLRQQLAEAPPEDRPRFEKIIQDHERLLKETRQERDGLVAQKQALGKK